MSSLPAWRKLESLATHYADSEDWSEDWSDWVDAQADLSLRWAHTLLVLSWGGSVMFKYRYYFTRQQNLFISYTIDIPPYLVDKTSIYHCSKGCFSSSSAFLWLFVLSLFCSALRSPRYGKLCWLSACVSMFVVSRFIKFTLVASKDTMYVADADVTFCFNSTRIVSLYMYM